MSVTDRNSRRKRRSIAAIEVCEDRVLLSIADLSVNMTTSAGTFLSGSNVSYTVTVANAGPDAAQTVALSTVVPANSTFVSDTQTSGPTFNLAIPAPGGTGTISETIDTLGSGAQATFNIVVMTSASTPAGTTISASTNVTTSSSDPNLANNSRTVTNLTATQADLSATTSAPSGTILAGNLIAYTITLANAGPSDAQNVGASNFVPANTSFVSEAQTSGPPFGAASPGSTDVAFITTFPAGASASFTFVVQVLSSTPAGTTITDTTTIGSDTSDPNLTDNSTTFTNLVAKRADLSVNQTIPPGPVLAGDPITYTITVSNTGPSDARDVALSDLVPANTTFVAAAQTSGPAFTLSSPAAGGTGSIGGSIGVLPAGASASFTIVVMVAAGTPNQTAISSTANVSTATTDPDLGNNTSTVTTGSIAGTGADVSVSSSTSASTVLAGSAFAETVTIANAGPEDAQNVSVSGLVPPHTTLVSITQLSGPAFSVTSPNQDGTGSITASIATLSSGASATFTGVFLVLPNTPAGTAIGNSISATTTASDPNLANNTAIATCITSTQADLSATATTSAGPYVAGKTITYTITLANSGPSDAQTVVGSVALLPYLTFVAGGQTSGPSFTIANPQVGGNSTITASIATLPAGTSASFNLVLLLSPSTPAGTMFTTTGVITAATTDPDPTDNTQTNTYLTAAQADVSVTNTISPGPVIAGEPITYSVTVSSAGPSDAQTVALRDVVPAGTTFLSVTQISGPAFHLTAPPPGGTGTINATVGTLASGASASFAIMVMLLSSTPDGTTISSVANVTTTTTDPDLANNSQTVPSVSATQADLSLTFASATSPVSAGKPVTCTISITNIGPSDAQNVALANPVPANTTYVSDAQISGPAFSLTSPAAGASGNVSATIGTLAAGASAVFNVVVLVTSGTSAGASISNTATVTAGTTDLTLANNSRTLTSVVTVLSPAVVAMQPTGNRNNTASLVITFSAPLNPTRAAHAANYQLMALRGPGPGRFKPGLAIRVKKVVYNAVAQTVKLRLAMAMNPQKYYQVTIKGAARGGIVGANGAPLAGGGTGKPGSNFAGIISPKTPTAISIPAIRAAQKSKANFSPRVHAISSTVVDALAVSGHLSRAVTAAEATL